MSCVKHITKFSHIILQGFISTRGTFNTNRRFSVLACRRQTSFTISLVTFCGAAALAIRSSLSHTLSLDIANTLAVSVGSRAHLISDRLYVSYFAFSVVLYAVLRMTAHISRCRSCARCACPAGICSTLLLYFVTFPIR